MTRREMGGLVGGAFLLAACGGKKSNGSSPAPRSSAPGSGAGRLPPVSLRGTTVPPGEQISVGDSRRYASLLNGAWRGGWHDSVGRSGTTDVSAAISPTSRTATVDVACSGEIFGAAIAPERYTINLAGFRRLAPTWHVVSPQLGSILASAQSGTDFTATVTSLPQSSIHTVDVQATRTGLRVDLRYQINPLSGPPVRGTMAWTKGSTRAVPAGINAVATATPANIQSGAYAAGLLSAADISNALGRPFTAPISNGGRLFYDTGVNVSNGLARSTDHKVNLQYSVYLCDSPAHARAFWKKESALGLPSIHGPWRDAYFLPSVSTMYAVEGTYVSTVQVQDLTGSPAPERIRAAAIALTKVLILKLPAKG